MLTCEDLVVQGFGLGFKNGWSVRVRLVLPLGAQVETSRISGDPPSSSKFLFFRLPGRKGATSGVQPAVRSSLFLFSATMAGRTGNVKPVTQNDTSHLSALSIEQLGAHVLPSSSVTPFEIK